MALHPKTNPEPTEADRLRRRIEDPEVTARAQAILAEIAHGEEPEEPGVTAKELPAFIRDRR